MSHDFDDSFERAPVCFSCGRELGPNPADVEYRGFGHRADGGPAWVATLCSCQTAGVAPGEPSPCVQDAGAFAADDGAPLTPDEYRRWLHSA